MRRRIIIDRSSRCFSINNRIVFVLSSPSVSCSPRLVVVAQCWVLLSSSNHLHNSPTIIPPPPRILPGTGVNEFIGNVRYRLVVRQVLNKFAKDGGWTTGWTTVVGKSSSQINLRLANEIVQKVKSRGGRFLERTVKPAVNAAPAQDEQEGEEGEARPRPPTMSPPVYYREVDYLRAIDKTRQSFRHQMMKFLEEADARRRGGPQQEEEAVVSSSETKKRKERQDTSSSTIDGPPCSSKPRRLVLTDENNISTGISRLSSTSLAHPCTVSRMVSASSKSRGVPPGLLVEQQMPFDDIASRAALLYGNPALASPSSHLFGPASSWLLHRDLSLSGQVLHSSSSFLLPPPAGTSTTSSFLLDPLRGRFPPFHTSSSLLAAHHYHAHHDQQRLQEMLLRERYYAEILRSAPPLPETRTATYHPTATAAASLLLRSPLPITTSMVDPETAVLLAIERQRRNRRCEE